MNNRKLRIKLTHFGLLICAMPFAFAGEWHEGNLLNSGDNKTWLEASSGDKLATAASTVASLYYNDYFKSSYSSTISGTDIDTMRPMAIELVACIDAATIDMTTTISVKYSDLAIGCAFGMGWVKS